MRTNQRANERKKRPEKKHIKICRIYTFFTLSFFRLMIESIIIRVILFACFASLILFSIRLPNGHHHLHLWSALSRIMVMIGRRCVPLSFECDNILSLHGVLLFEAVRAHVCDRVRTCRLLILCISISNFVVLASPLRNDKTKEDSKIFPYTLDFVLVTQNTRQT